MNSSWMQFLHLEGVEDSVRRLLRNDGWLKDTIIDYYFDYITKQRPKTCVLPSYCQKVESVIQVFKSRFESHLREMIIFPMNLENTHWCLLLFHLGTNEIRIYDSLHSKLTNTHSKYIKKVKDLFKQTNRYSTQRGSFIL